MEEHNIDDHKMNIERDLMNSPMSQFMDKEKYPDFWEQMQNFKEFAKSVGQQAATGNGVVVTQEKLDKRKETCLSCSQFNKEHKRCYMCGCYMEMKWKFEAAKCPMSLW